MGRIGGIYADGKKSWIEKIDRKNIKKTYKKCNCAIYKERDGKRVGWRQTEQRQRRDPLNMKEMGKMERKDGHKKK